VEEEEVWAVRIQMTPTVERGVLAASVAVAVAVEAPISLKGGTVVLVEAEAEAAVLAVVAESLVPVALEVVEETLQVAASVVLAVAVAVEHSSLYLVEREEAELLTVRAAA